MIVAILHISAFNTDSEHISSVQPKKRSQFPYPQKSDFPDCRPVFDLPLT